MTLGKNGWYITSDGNIRPIPNGPLPIDVVKIYATHQGALRGYEAAQRRRVGQSARRAYSRA